MDWAMTLLQLGAELLGALAPPRRTRDQARDVARALEALDPVVDRGGRRIRGGGRFLHLAPPAVHAVHQRFDHLEPSLRDGPSLVGYGLQRAHLLFPGFGDAAGFDLDDADPLGLPRLGILHQEDVEREVPLDDVVPSGGPDRRARVQRYEYGSVHL